MEWFSAHREVSFRCKEHNAEIAITINQKEEKFEKFESCDGDGDGGDDEPCEGGLNVCAIFIFFSVVVCCVLSARC